MAQYMDKKLAFEIVKGVLNLLQSEDKVKSLLPKISNNAPIIYEGFMSNLSDLYKFANNEYKDKIVNVVLDNIALDNLIEVKEVSSEDTKSVFEGQYLSKDKVVTTIERLQDECEEHDDNNGVELLEKLFNKLDTLEMKKEVDLKKHLKEDIEDVFFDLNGVAVKGATHYLTVGDVKELAKHFYELGLKTQVQSIWHDYLESIEIDKTILIVSPNGNSSLALWNGKELLSTTLGGGNSALCKGDQWVYIEDLDKAQKGE